MTAGLSRINLDRLLTEALEAGVRITPDVLKEKKKEIIQAECHGLLEFIEPATHARRGVGPREGQGDAAGGVGRAEAGPHRGDADGLPDVAARRHRQDVSWLPASPATSACLA